MIAHCLKCEVRLSEHNWPHGVGQVCQGCSRCGAKSTHGVPCSLDLGHEGNHLAPLPWGLTHDEQPLLDAALAALGAMAPDQQRAFILEALRRCEGMIRNACEARGISWPGLSTTPFWYPR